MISMNLLPPAERRPVIPLKRVFAAVSLAGIMNIKPFCRGERPWDSENRPEICRSGHDRTIMQMALVTSNSIYYANSLSSLYIPNEYIEKPEGQLSAEANKMLKKIEEKILLGL